MSQNPFNLALRFILELTALAAMGYWGWTKFDGILRYVLAAGVPLLAAYIWGTYRVPNDGGAPRVQVRGYIRLLIEVAFFSFATWALFDAQAVSAARIFGGLALLHYLVSYDRILWILKQ